MYMLFHVLCRRIFVMLVLHSLCLSEPVKHTLQYLVKMLKMQDENSKARQRIVKRIVAAIYGLFLPCSPILCWANQCMRSICQEKPSYGRQIFNPSKILSVINNIVCCFHENVKGQLFSQGRWESCCKITLDNTFLSQRLERPCESSGISVTSTLIVWNNVNFLKNEAEWFNPYCHSPAIHEVGGWAHTTGYELVCMSRG